MFAYEREKKDAERNFRLSHIFAVNYHISNGVSVYFAKFCSHIKKEKKKMRKENFEFHIYLLWIITSVTGLSVYFAKFCSHMKERKKMRKENFEFRIYICCELSHPVTGLSVYFAKFCSHLQKKKKKRKEIFDFRIYLMWIITSVTGYQFISQNSVRIWKRKKRCEKKILNFAYIFAVNYHIQ